MPSDPRLSEKPAETERKTLTRKEKPRSIRILSGRGGGEKDDCLKE